MKARYLKRAVLDQLWQEVPNSLHLYREGEFDHLSADASTHFEAMFDVEEARFAELQPGDDAGSEAIGCKVLIEAIPGLRPYEARDERLWAYLTHTVLLPYTRARWTIPAEDEKAVGFIRAHFFARGPRGFERENAASRLWWMGHLCRRISGMPLQEALAAFLYRSDVRANIIERPTICQNPQIFSAILKALRASAANDRALFKRALFRPFMIGLNSVGGVRLLDCMPEPEISNLITQLVQPLVVSSAAALPKRAKAAWPVARAAQKPGSAKRAKPKAKAKKAKAVRTGRKLKASNGARRSATREQAAP